MNEDNSKLCFPKTWNSRDRATTVKAVYCHPAYLTSMQSTSCEMPGCMKHKLESRLLEKISIENFLKVMTDTKPWNQEAQKHYGE